jgi:hypothetical protein
MKVRTVLAGGGDFSLQNSTPAVGTSQPSIQFFSGLKHQEREAYYSFPSRDDVKYVCGATSWSKSLCAPDVYSAKNTQKYFKQFQSLTMIT